MATLRAVVSVAFVAVAALARADGELLDANVRGTFLDFLIKTNQGPIGCTRHGETERVHAELGRGFILHVIRNWNLCECHPFISFVPNDSSVVYQINYTFKSIFCTNW